MAIFRTSDLSDKHSSGVGFQVAEPLFHNFGRRKRFSGLISTIKVYEDNALLVDRLEQMQAGSVLVVDGGASVKRALFGDKLARIAMTKHIAGIIINGAVRDVDRLLNFDLAVLALAACPLKCHQEGKGEHNIKVNFAAVDWQPNHYVYGDEDGLILSPFSLV